MGLPLTTGGEGGFQKLVLEAGAVTKILSAQRPML